VSRNPRELYVEALDALLKGEIVQPIRRRDWELVREIARLAQSDAPPDLAMTDAALFESWRAAVTRFHLQGWTNMTPERVEEVCEAENARVEGRAS
jgi:hypothetical protein